MSLLGNTYKDKINLKRQKNQEFTKSNAKIVKNVIARDKLEETQEMGLKNTENNIRNIQNQKTNKLPTAEHILEETQNVHTIN